MPTQIDWLVALSTGVLLAILIASWLASYRFAPQSPIDSRDWFFGWPQWAQIVGGLLGSALLAGIAYWLWIPLPVTVPPEIETIMRVLGLALFLPGSAVVLWARWTLGTLYGVSTSFAAPLQAQHRLVRHGPYRLVRHPMYLGIWILLLGLVLIYGTWTPFAFFVMCLAAFYRRGRREDRALADRFGEVWRAYAARTKFIIPFLY